MAKTTFTEQGVSRLQPPAAGQIDRFERQRRGLTLALRVSSGGTKTWRLIYYRAGRPRVKSLGRYPAMSVQQARKAAAKFDPQAELASAGAGSFREVAESWLVHYVDAKQLRSKGEIERQLKRYLYPTWERRRFFEILDAIAERVLGHVIKGVEGVYNRHSYLEEKAEALEKLASLVEKIAAPGGSMTASASTSAPNPASASAIPATSA